MLTPEQQYRLASEFPGDVVYHTGPDQLCQWISDSITTVADWDPTELLGTRITDLVHPDDRAATQPVRDALHAGTRVEIAAAGMGGPMRIRQRDGSYRWIAAVAVPFTDEHGRPDGIVGRLRDIDDLVRARERAEAGEARLVAILDALADPLVMVRPVRDESGTVVDLLVDDANDAAAAFFGIPSAEMRGSMMLGIRGVDTIGRAFGKAVEAISSGTMMSVDGFAYTDSPGAQTRYLDVRAVPTGDQLIVVWRDVSERVAEQHALAERELVYRLVTESMSDAVVRWSDDGIVTWVSPSYTKLSGYRPEDVIGRSGTELVDFGDAVADERAREQIRLRDGSEIRVRYRCADGSLRWVAARTQPYVGVDGTPDGSFTVLSDVDAEVRIQEMLDHQLGHDPLTGLANKDLGLTRIQHALDEIDGSWRTIALLCVGVDDLTTINQALTYQGGDQVLVAIAARISAAVGTSDVVARVAGDEFALLVPDLTGGLAAATVAQRICEQVNRPLDVQGHTVTPTVSIGIATPARGTSADSLLRDASLAMRAAKREGHGRWAFVDPILARQAETAFVVEEALRDAIARGEVVPWFMPIVALDDRRLAGYEALARWVKPDGEVIPPDSFMAVAERTGLVVDVDMRVLELSLEALRGLPSHITVGVNISAATLNSPKFASRVTELLTTAGIRGYRLKFEVTETALVHVTTTIHDAVHEVAELGVRWYVDDFGTGYSSISHLRDLPIAGLKLDRSFTSGIGAGDPTSISLARGLAGLADGLQLDTVAEGVESEHEARLLFTQGWHHGQGWLFGKAEPGLRS